MRNMRQFWSPRRIGEDRVTMARLGPLRLWLARADKEWGFASEEAEMGQVLDIAQVPEDVVPDNLEWTTTLFSTAPREFLLMPVIPERPVVIRPNHAVLIPPGELGRFYCLLPVLVRITVSIDKKETILATVPSCRMSDTWFGLPTSGELCYAVSPAAEQNLENLQPFPHHIVCPIEIQNLSEELLTFEKLCFRPQYVGIFCGDSNLWASCTRIQHEGSLRRASVRYAVEAPPEEPDLVRLAKPLKREETVLSRLTFSSGFMREKIFGK